MCPSRNFSSQLFNVWNVITSRYKHHNNSWLYSHIWECSPQNHLQLQEQTLLDQSSNDLVNNTVSGYFATFVCWATKATCFATMTSITTDTFLAAFRQCITPQGKPRPIYLHTGTKFKGATSQLFIFHTNTTFWWSMRSRSRFHEAPLEVYVWKSDKLTKTHKYFVRNRSLSKLSTSVCSIQWSQDASYLSLRHFLTVQSLTQTASSDLTNIKINRFPWWQQLQKQAQHFWQQLSTIYFQEFPQQHQWLTLNTQPPTSNYPPKGR